MTRDRPRIDYNEQESEQFIRQRLAGLPELVIKAARGYPQPLIDDFESSGPRQLSKEEWGWLIWLFNKLPRSGRPRGSMKPKNFAIQCASYLVRWGKQTQREVRGRTRNTVNDKLYQRAVELMQAEIPKARDEFVVGDVQAFTAKPSRDVEVYVRENMEHALREMDRIVLEDALREIDRRNALREMNRIVLED